MPVPPLKHYEGSWVAVSRASGKAVLETFSRATAEAVNQTRYEVVTIGDWLVRYNRQVRTGKGS